MLKKAILYITLIFLMTACLSSCASEKKPAADTKDLPAKEQPKAEAPKDKIIDPLSLISREEAEKLLGIALKEAELTDNKAVGMKLCFYDSGKDGTGFLQVSIVQKSLMPEALIKSGQNPVTIYEATKQNFQGALIVDGIGEDAFIAPPGLHILKDGFYIVIAVGNSDNEENRKILKEAGKLAVLNLEKATK